MKLQSGINKRYRQCFVLDEDALRRIEGVLHNAQTKLPPEVRLVYHVERSDNRFYETETLDDVLADPNVSQRKVNRLEIALRTPEEHPSSTGRRDSSDLVRITFAFDDSNELQFLRRDVTFRITSEDRTWSLLLADELEPQILRIFKAHRTPRWILYLFSAPFIILFVKTGELIDNEKYTKFKSVVLSALIALFLFVILPTMLKYTRSPRWFTRYFGPESVFLWGDEVEYYQNREQLRKNVFWMVLVGFLISFVASGLWVFWSIQN